MVPEGFQHRQSGHTHIRKESIHLLEAYCYYNIQVYLTLNHYNKVYRLYLDPMDHSYFAD